ncbi:hypothetical protein SLA2020_066500 [Shorea laevis]
MAASLNKRVLLILVIMAGMLILALSSERRKIDSNGMLMPALNSEGRRIDSNSIIHRLGYDASKLSSIEGCWEVTHKEFHQEDLILSTTTSWEPPQKVLPSK